MPLRVRLTTEVIGTSSPVPIGLPSEGEGGGSVGSVPTVTTLPETSVGSDRYTANGSVNPNGALTDVWIEHGTTTSYGTATTPISIGSGTSPISVSVLVSGRSASTTYHYRVVAENANGTVFGADETVTTTAAPPAGTAPDVTASAASSITTTGATLTGTVNPGNLATDCHWEWGTVASGAYGNTGPTTTVAAGGSAVAAPSLVLASLSAGTAYQARLIGTNSVGSDTSSITFTTTGAAPVPPTMTTRDPDQIT